MLLTWRSDRRRRRAARPSLEGLEDRKLLYATTGNLWAYGSRITYSFAPDGTSIGGVPSNLFSTMTNMGFSTANWQAQFERAAAVWQAVTNTNLALVPDGGQAYGTSGNQQDDSRFGDIRIGGEALAPNVLASCFLPPPDNGGTLAGDIVMNTSQPWQINNDYDIETVAIHEIGHALGMDHSAILSACMYAFYVGQKQSLVSDDIAGIQTIYGARQPDAFDAAASNNAANTATNLNPYVNAQGQASIANLDITTNTDYDWYVLSVPSSTTGTLTVTMQSSNLSSLSPKVLVLGSAQQTLASASAANSYGSTVTVTIPGVAAGQKLYIKCMAANSGPSGTGAYGLLVNFGSGTLAPIAPPNTAVAQQADQGGGSLNEILHDITIGTLKGSGDDLETLGAHLPGRSEPATRGHARAHIDHSARDAAIHAWHPRRIA